MWRADTRPRKDRTPCALGGVNWAAVGCLHEVSGDHQGPAEGPGLENSGEVGRTHRSSAALGLSAQASGRKQGDKTDPLLLPMGTSMGQRVCRGRPFGPGQGGGPSEASLCGYSKPSADGEHDFIPKSLFICR